MEGPVVTPLEAELIRPPWYDSEENDSPRPSLVFSSCDDPKCRFEFAEMRRQVGYWKSQHARAVEREARLKEEIAALEAKLRLREGQLFAAKSEKGSSGKGTSGVRGSGKRRGQQQGSQGHQRRDYSHLPTTTEEADLPEEGKRCGHCGQPFKPFPGTEDSQTIEIDVRAYRRVLKRKRYRPTCNCGCHPGIITAPPPARLLPKTIFGISVWVTVLLDKFLFYRPTYRLLEDLRSHDLDLSLGTLTDGLKRLAPLLEPIYEGLKARHQHEHLWHADETRWYVFIIFEGKVGHRWQLWAYQSASAIVFHLDPSRSHEVPERHFGHGEEGILVVDRYVAYKIIVAVKDGRIILAFCWAHVRRDFVDLAQNWPQLETWALTWVQDIGSLYHHNEQRLLVLQDPQAFAERDQVLRVAVDQMAQHRDEELARPDLHPACRKVLESQRKHWPGLTVFVDHPEVPMDNNAMERSQRGPVLGRKNYYGSGSLWSGILAAMAFSIFQTLRLWNLNPRKWLTAYFEACAANGSQAPADADRFLPWNLSDQERQELAYPADQPTDNSS